jgi:hypothetical protein
MNSQQKKEKLSEPVLIHSLEALQFCRMLARHAAEHYLK